MFSLANTMDTNMTGAAPKPQSDSSIQNLLQTPHSDAFTFSDQEKHILRLYDQLAELELEQALYKAQNEAQTPDFSSLSDDALQVQLIKAQSEAAEARAEYLLRSKITQSVMVTDPILKAVHGGATTGYAEKRILPLISERDVVSMIHGDLASKLASTLHELSAVEKKNVVALETNKKLAQTLLPLAQEMKAQSTDDIQDPQLRAEIHAAEKEAKNARKTVRLLKGVLSGMIVGSGVNWAEDEVLRELVMDDEDDD